MEEFNLEGLNTELRETQEQLNTTTAEYQRAAKSLNDARMTGNATEEAIARSEMSRLVIEIDELQNRINELQNSIQEGPEIQNQLNERRTEYQRAAKSLNDARMTGNAAEEAIARSEMARVVAEMTELQNRINELQGVVSRTEPDIPEPTQEQNIPDPEPENDPEVAEAQNRLNERTAEYERTAQRYNDARANGNDTEEAALRAEITRLVAEINELRSRVNELENRQTENRTSEPEQDVPAETKKDDRFDDLTTLMDNIRTADEMSRDKLEEIDRKREELRNETRPVVVEELREEVAKLERDKVEFDEMTRASLENARKEATEMQQESEKAYNEKLVEFLNRKKDIEHKLETMRGRGLTPEKMAMAERAAQKALDDLNREMASFQTEHFEKRSKLDDYMKYIDNSINVTYVDVKYEAPEQDDNGQPKPAPQSGKDGDGQGKDGDSQGQDGDDQGKDGDGQGQDGDGQGKDGDGQGQDGDGQGKDGDDQGKDGDDQGKDGDGQGKDGDGQGQDGDGQGKDGDGQGKDGDDQGKDGDGQGKDGDDQGKDGDGQGKDGDGQGKDGDGQGKDGDGQGKDGDGQGKDGDGQGKDGDGQGKDGDGQGKDGDGQGKDGDGQGKDGQGQGGKGDKPQEPVYKVGKIRGFLLKIVQAILNKVKPDGFMGKFFGGVESTLLVGAKEALPVGKSKSEPTKPEPKKSEPTQTPVQPTPEKVDPEQDEELEMLAGEDDSEWAREQVDRLGEMDKNSLMWQIIEGEYRQLIEDRQGKTDEDLQKMVKEEGIPEITEQKGKDTAFQNILYYRVAQRALDMAEEKGIDLVDEEGDRVIDDIYADLEKKYLQEKTNEASKKAAEQQGKGGEQGRDNQGKDPQQDDQEK